MSSSLEPIVLLSLIVGVIAALILLGVGVAPDYGSKKGAPRRWLGGRDKSTVIDDRPNYGHLKREKAHRSVAVRTGVTNAHAHGF